MTRNLLDEDQADQRDAEAAPDHDCRHARVRRVGPASEPGRHASDENRHPYQGGDVANRATGAERGHDRDEEGDPGTTPQHLEYEDEDVRYPESVDMRPEAEAPGDADGACGDQPRADALTAPGRQQQNAQAGIQHADEAIRCGTDLNHR